MDAKEKEKIARDRIAYSINLDIRMKAAERSLRQIESQLQVCKSRLDRAQQEEKIELMKTYEKEYMALQGSYQRIVDNCAQINILKSQVAAENSDKELMDSVDTLLLLSKQSKMNNTAAMSNNMSTYNKQQKEANRVKALIETNVTNTNDANSPARVSKMQEEQNQKVADFLAMTTFGTVAAQDIEKNVSN
jgi:predicted component of viral defense system (DUF524 family)